MSKTKKTVFYILLVIVSALFLFSGYAKLVAQPTAVQSFVVAGLPIWFMYVVGTGEVLGAIGLWIPKTRFWASLGLAEVLAGAIILSAVFVNIPIALFPLATAVALFFVVRLGKQMKASTPETTQM